MMRTGLKLTSLLVMGVLCLGGSSYADSSHRQRKPKKPELPTIPSGPQGPVQQVPLDAIPAVAPHVTYLDGQLTIVAPNSTLGDVLRAVRKQTSAEMDIPATATERVVTHLGPGPARSVVAELLNGSKFNYILLGSPSDTAMLTRVVLVAKTGGETPAPNQQQPQQAVMNPVGNMAPPPTEAAEAPDAESAEDAPADDTADQAAEQAAAEAEQPAVIQDQQQQSGIKTPQQMLQEMQQRQQQMQQQLAPGQPPIPGGAIPPRLPQQTDPPQE